MPRRADVTQISNDFIRTRRARRDARAAGVLDRDAGGLVVHVMMTEEEIAEKSLRIGVNNADAVVWGPVSRGLLMNESSFECIHPPTLRSLGIA